MACRNFSITLIQVESNKQCKVSVDKNFCMLHFHFNILYISLLLCFIVSFHLTTFDYHSIVCTEFLYRLTFYAGFVRNHSLHYNYVIQYSPNKVVIKLLLTAKIYILYDLVKNV